MHPYHFFGFYRKARSLWRPEFASYMIEGTPGKPYGGLLAHFNIVEANMKYRRDEVNFLLFILHTFVLKTLNGFGRFLLCWGKMSKSFPLPHFRAWVAKDFVSLKLSQIQ